VRPAPQLSPYIFRADFRHEFPARGLRLLTRQPSPLPFFGRLCLFFFHDPDLWFPAPARLTPFWLARLPYSTMVWASPGAPGARPRKTTIKTATNNFFTKAVLYHKLRRGCPLQKAPPHAKLLLNK